MKLFLAKVDKSVIRVVCRFIDKYKDSGFKYGLLKALNNIVFGGGVSGEITDKVVNGVMVFSLFSSSGIHLANFNDVDSLLKGWLQYVLSLDNVYLDFSCIESVIRGIINSPDDCSFAEVRVAVIMVCLSNLVYCRRYENDLALKFYNS